MAYVPPVWNQKSPCWLQTFLKHSAPSLQCLTAVHNEIYDISSSVVSYTFLACVAAEEFALNPNRIHCDCNCFYFNVNNSKYCVQKFIHLYTA